MDETNLQILNTKAPVGDSSLYTITFTLQSKQFSISSGRVLLDKTIVEDLKESEKAGAVLKALGNELAVTK
ncbi:hypothetical protein [Ligilactobacillus acidipiscis]|uniref:Uncharacterized protein n=1 Tax=Ligilactobacillus acidipiscis TaxID=89059 RepID=A0A0R2KPF2_9LACO|nr:hypothetical protein [Ligilactobacillus acidipiscis]KRN88205.1 hypothetical protein IV43_GL000056 [Ligilactobacillus acidipiscis]